jgi:hypothetical protein
MAGRLCFLDAVLTIKSLDTACRIDQALLAGVKRMTP